VTGADRTVGTRLLRLLLNDGTIGDLVPGPVLRLLVRNSPAAGQIKGQIYLDLIGAWTMLPTSSKLPELAELPDIPTDAQVNALLQLHGQRIIDVQLGEPHPNLALSLSSGNVLFVNGHDQQYECWQVGVYGGQAGELWQIIAGPEDELSIWAPGPFLQAN